MMSARTSPPYLRDGTLVIEPEGEFAVDPATYGADACIAGLDRAGLDVAVVSCPPTLGIDALPDDEAGELRDAYHEGALAAVDASDGRLLALAMDRPRDGFVGTIVAADDLSDLDRVAPVFDETERRGGFVLVHPGVARPPAGAPGWWASAVDYTTQMQRAYGVWLSQGVERWPNVRVVFSILAGGAPFQLERMQSRGYDIRNALHPSLYLETSSYGRRSIEFCLATFGANQMLFGSDAPVLDSCLTLDHVRSFGHAAIEALCQDNPTALLA